MSDLNGVIGKYADTKRKLGTENSVLTDDQVDNLKKDLMSISSKNKIFFWICVGMVVLVFLLALILIIFNIEKPDKIQIIFSITGVSVMGLIVYMNKLWKEKVNTDMLLALIGTLQKEIINTILVALINKI